MSRVTVAGAGLWGSKCAWQLARCGIEVRLVEMKPGKFSPAHVSANFAELVCSNSLRSDELTNAVGLLKEELRRPARSSWSRRIRTAGRPAARWPWTARAFPPTSPKSCAPAKHRGRRASSDIRRARRSSPQACSRATPWPRASWKLAPSSTCTSTTPSRPSSRSRAWTWIAPTWPRATAKGTADYVNCPMSKGRVRGLPQRSCAQQRRPRCTARRWGYVRRADA